MIQNDVQFIDALALQRVTRVDLHEASTPHTRKRLEKEYETVTKHLRDYLDKIKK